MRLIDADVLLENIVHLNNVYVQGRMAYIIDNQKIAFEKEKVISELETLKSRYGKEDFSYIGIIEKAISIVRKGGVESSMTQADKIRTMSDEELAEYISELIRDASDYITGKENWLQWLKLEVKEVE